MKRAAIFLSTALAAPGAALAQSSFELNEAIVYSGLIPVAANRTGASVDVLDAGQIDGGPVAIDDRLERLPGVTVTTSGPLGGDSVIRIRGLPQRYTGVTLDGIDITDPSLVQTYLNFGTLTRALTERIEVAKGTQTAVYGANAIAGAINMTSWRPQKAGLSWGAEAEAGSYGTALATLHLGQRDAGGEAALTLSKAHSDGFSARPGNTEADGFDQNALAFHLERKAGEAVTLGVSGFATRSHSEYDASDSDPTGDYYENKKAARVFARFDGDRVDHEISASLYQIDREDPTGFTKVFAGRRAKLAYQGTAGLGDAATLAFGADWVKESASSDGSGASARNAAVFGEVQAALGPSADLSVSVRRDQNSDFGGKTTGRAALAYRVSENTTLRAVLGTGFRAPSLYERYGPYGMAGLQPETSTSYELGVEHRAGAAVLRVTAFRNRIENLIDFDLGTFTYNQVPGVTLSEGVELSAEVPLGRASLFGNYTYTDSTNPSGRSLRVPRHDLTVGIEAPLTERLKGALTVRRIADRLDVDSSFATVKAPDYTVAGLRLSYALSETTEVYLRVENLLGADYQEVLTYNSPGRSVYAGLRAAF